MNFSSQNAIEDESTSVSETSVVEEIKFKRTSNRSGEPEIKKLVLHNSQSTNQIVLSSPRAFANDHSHLDENDSTRKNSNVVDMKSSNDSNILSHTRMQEQDVKDRRKKERKETFPSLTSFSYYSSNRTQETARK